MSRISQLPLCARSAYRCTAVSACANMSPKNPWRRYPPAPGSADFVVNVGDACSSKRIRTELTPTARDARMQRNGSTNIPLQFHTKATPTNAARANIIALGARRAQAASFHRLRHPEYCMRTVSYGKERPVAVCDDISCWSQNRRAVIVLGVTS